MLYFELAELQDKQERLKMAFHSQNVVIFAG